MNTIKNAYRRFSDFWLTVVFEFEKEIVCALRVYVSAGNHFVTSKLNRTRFRCVYSFFWFAFGCFEAEQVEEEEGKQINIFTLFDLFDSIIHYQLTF